MNNKPAPQPTKRAVNITLDSALVVEARALGIPLSATLGAALEACVVAERQRRFLEANRHGIEDYNARIDRDGMWSDGLRLF
jgi:antitoxin CcdA